MEQASRILGRVAGEDVISLERIVLAAWKRAVGKKVAPHARAAKLVRTTLIVDVDDESWRESLWTLRFQIFRKMEEQTGPGVVTDLTLRVIPPRIEPRRAGASEPAFELRPPDTPADDADGIADPGLRRIYRARRRRETA